MTWDQYATAWTALHGGIDPRRSRPSVERWLRLGYWLAKICARLRLKPSAITAIGLVACLFVPIGTGHGNGGALLAALLVVVAAITDTVDGALAVMTERATRLGYVYDSVVDRIGEACWLLAMWRIGVHGWIVVLAGALSWLHEYTRSRANAAGMTEIGASTLGERPTRVILAVLAFGLAGLTGAGSRSLPSGIVTFIATVWIVLGVIGFLQLFANIHRALAGRPWRSSRRPAPAPPEEPPSAWTTVYASEYSGGRHLAVDDFD
ncbi:MAG TPA: CDP-alcohol phosphatidyltransferase family protein [Micromonosporaceae bacterium]|jgi:CDP-diacylglycerol--glycerol-3-phosphate 3-phosphatidyltransferase